MISAIVLTDRNYGIGKNNELLFDIPEDKRRFKSITDKSTVIMGRKTWESLPKKPLTNRMNLIITHQKIDSNEDDIKFISMEEAKLFLENNSNKNIYIIGGGEIYKQLLPYYNVVQMTYVFDSIEVADTFFPKIEEHGFELIYASTIYTNEKLGLHFQYRTYIREQKE